MTRTISRSLLITLAAVLVLALVAAASNSIVLARPAELDGAIDTVSTAIPAVSAPIPAVSAALPESSAALPESLPAQAGLIPFDPAPPIVLPTSRGELAVGQGMPGDESYVLLGHSTKSALSEELWNASFGKLITESPLDVNFVLASYGETPAAVQSDIDAVRSRVEAAIAALPDEAAREHWADHFHYVTENPLTLGGSLPELLMDWGAVLADVTADWVDESGDPQRIETRGTTDSGWAKSLTESGPITAPLAWYGGLACADEVPVQEVTGRIALIERGVCPFTEKVANAERHGAAAALLFTDADREKIRMSGSCDPCPAIPAAMIDRQPGLDLQAKLEALTPVTVTLAPMVIGAELLAIDHQARVREFGFIPFPFNNYLDAPLDNLYLVALEMQAIHHEHERDSRLAAEEASGAVDVVPLIEGEWVADPGWAGVRTGVEVELPDAATMATYDALEVDLSIGCTDHRHSNCPAWDYIADLFLCAPEEAEGCSILVGRWITPYWSEGHWVTDITPLLGYLSDGGRRRFEFYTQQRYEVDLSLRFADRHQAAVPTQALDLKLNGGAFWDDYNSRFQPIEFEVPDWADKVEVVSFITGHGFGKDKENCAEFCNHEHHIAVNGSQPHVKLHPEAGTELGCALQVPDGAVPNQGGTWIYGRGGWCPGLDVKPWVIDITDEVKKGETNELVYRGLFNGQDYVPEKAADQDPNEPFDANIQMRSYVVYSVAKTAGIYLPIAHNGEGE